MRYIRRPKPLTAKDVFVVVEGEKKPLTLEFVRWLRDIALSDPSWRAGGNLQAMTTLALKLAIEEKVEALAEDWTFLELTDEEHEMLGTKSRAGERGYVGEAAVFNAKFDRFHYAIAAAVKDRPKSVVVEAAAMPDEAESSN